MIDGADQLVKCTYPSVPTCCIFFFYIFLSIFLYGELFSSGKVLWGWQHCVFIHFVHVAQELERGQVLVA